MAQIYWFNGSGQPIKWMAYVNSQWQGDMLNPQQTKIMDDAGVVASGWSFSGFSGFTYSMSPANTPAGYSAYNVALDTLEESEDLLSKLKDLPTSE